MEDFEKNRPKELMIFNEYGFEIPKEHWEELGITFEENNIG
jgi:hypothetical protein